MRKASLVRSAFASSLILLATLLPLISPATFNLVAFKSSLWYIILYLGIIALAVVSFIGRDREVKISYGFLAAALLPVVYFLSAITNGLTLDNVFGTQPGATSILSVLSFVLTAYVVFNLFRDTNWLGWLFRGLVVGSILTSVTVIILSMVGNGSFISSILSLNPTTIGTWNTYAVYAGLVLGIVALALGDPGFRQNTNIWKYLAIFSGLLQLFVLLIINFTGVWIILLISMVAVMLYYWRQQGENEPAKAILRRYSLPAVLSLISFVALFVGSSVSVFLSRLLNVSFLEVQPSLASSLSIAGQSLANSPWLGSGPSSFVYQWYLYKPLQINLSQFWQVPFASGGNIFLTSLVTVGLLGFFAWIIFFIVSMFGVVRAAQRLGSQSQSWFLQMPLYGTLYLLLSLLVLPLQPIILFFLAISLGVVWRLSSFNSWSRSFTWPPELMKAVHAVVGIVALVMLVFTGRQIIAAVQFAAAAQTSDISVAEQKVERAIAIYPSADYYRALANARLINLLQPSSGQSSRTITDEQINAVLEPLGKAIKKQPQNYLNWQLVGDALAQIATVSENNNLTTQARQAYQQALQFYPRNPELYFKLALLEARAENQNAARTYAREALRVKPNYFPAIDVLTSQAKTQEDVQEAADFLVQLINADPSSAEARVRLALLLIQAQDYQNAAALLEQALQIDPYAEAASYYLALTYEKLGRFADAQTLLERLIQNNPDNPQITAALQRVRQQSPSTSAESAGEEIVNEEATNLNSTEQEEDAPVVEE